jgi:hypothetical protein
MQEQWRTVAGFPDYSVSNLGRVRRDAGGRGAVAGRVLKATTASNGYAMVGPRNGGKTVTKTVHRFVAVAFLGPSPTDAHQVAHNDGDPLNNHAHNLRWATCAENHADKNLHGTHIRGERHPFVKLSAGDVLAIRAEHAKGLRSQVEIGLSYGISAQQVGRIGSKKQWAHLPD